MIDGVASYVAECFWPDVAESDLEALDARVREVTAGLLDDESVRYLGSILLRQDEVVLCQFEGSAGAVRDIAERAQIPFERIQETAHSPWPVVKADG
jgi:hypothetical protein